MAASKITYNDKEQGQINPAPTEQKYTFGDANEVKDSVNANADLLDFASLQTGVLTGGEVTINAGDNTKFDVAAGTGVIINWSTPSTPIRTFVSWNAFIAQTLPNIGGLFTTVSIDSTATLILVSGVAVTPQLRRTTIRLQTVTHVSGVSINGISRSSKPAYDAVEALLDYVNKLGVVNEGNTFFANGANLNIDKLAGTSTLPYINRSQDTQSPTTLINDAITLATFSTIYRDGLGDFTITPSLTDIDPDLWDDGSGTLQSVGNNKWTIKRIYFFSGGANVAVTYGQAIYSNREDAENAIFTEQPILSPLFNLGVFVTSLIIKKGTTDLTNDANVSFINISLLGVGGGAFSNTEISQTLNFIDIATFFYTQGQNYKIDSITQESGVTATLKIGGTATNYVLGDSVSAFDKLDITVDVVGAITIKGTLI